MKINLALNALIYITLSFFYMESRCCIKIDREVQDKIDSLNRTNCDGISHSIFEAGICRCSINSESSIVTSYTGDIACVSNTYLERGEYTWIFFCLVSFPLKKLWKCCIILFADLLRLLLFSKLLYFQRFLFFEWNICVMMLDSVGFQSSFKTKTTYTIYIP